MTDALTLQRILRETRSVAIVGASANPSRASYSVWTYLKSASDYELYLVNPTVSQIDGTKVYPSLAELPVVPDMVARDGKAAGLQVVQDLCLQVEHARFV